MHGNTMLMQISSSGAITTTGVISGSNALSASYAVNATTSSFAASSTSASYALNATTSSFAASATSASYAVSATTASFANSLTVAGTLTAQTLVVQTITSSVDFVTGSTRFGSIIGNTHQFTGSLSITGSLNVNNTLYVSSSNVGIGTSSPSQPLQLGQVSVIAQDQNSMYVGANFANAVDGNYIKSQYANQIHFDSAQGHINFKVAGTGSAGAAITYTTAMRITSAGNVGILTSSPSERFDVNTGQGARAGMALSGEYPYLRFNVSSSNANARNWAFNATNAEPGDFALLQSTAKDGNPVTAGTSILGFGRSGAATFSSTLQSRGLVVVGASGGYTTGDNTYINLGGAASADTFGAINAPFGDVMKFNSYHGYQFKTSNSTASPVTMFSIGISGAATFASSVTLNGDLNLAGSAEINHTGRMLFDAGAGNGFLFRVNNVATQALSIDSTGASTFPVSVISTKFNTFNSSLSVANNTATFMQQCAADGGNGSMYLIVAAIGGAGVDRIAMGILVTVSQGGGTARWAFQSDGTALFLTDPGNNGNIHVRHTVGGTQTINYSILRIG
jgi:hypothetical protein